MTPNEKITELTARIKASEKQKAALTEKLQAAKSELKRLKAERDQRQIVKIQLGLGKPS